jgi:hypothetical protein
MEGELSFAEGAELSPAQQELLGIGNEKTRKFHETMESFDMSSPEYAHNLSQTGIECGLQRGFAQVDSLVDRLAQSTDETEGELSAAEVAALKAYAKETLILDRYHEGKIIQTGADFLPAVVKHIATIRGRQDVALGLPTSGELMVTQGNMMERINLAYQVQTKVFSS